MTIDFRPNTPKMLEAIVWLATKRSDLDRLKISKIFFYADREHLRTYGRPILGDQYVAMKEGPVPSAVYDILKCNENRLDYLFLQEISSALDEAKTDPDQKYPVFAAKRAPHLDDFSESDLECLKKWLEYIGPMEPMALWRMVHDEPEYKKTWAQAQAGGDHNIPYEEMLDTTNAVQGELKEILEEESQYIAI